MGDEITQRYFDAEAFSRFRELLDEETALLEQVFKDNTLSPRGDTAGFELEAWLVDEHGAPLPENETLLARLDNALVVPELARFNIELNGSTSNLSGSVFSRLEDELAATWRACTNAARDMNARLVTIGTLPTAREDIFTSDNMSGMVRYHSLNDRVMALRDGRHLDIHIEGEEPLELTHDDVMLEAAATSFQIHLQCRPERAVRDFNASLIASAPMAAVAANAPLLFGHLLWDESRIPLFEQSVDIGELYSKRVGFGTGYAQNSLFEIFAENQRAHPILIPMVHPDAPPSKFSHVRFHNGTVWRWNRPLIGFDFDGQVHLRIEHRVTSAGPTVRDSISNAAFYFGLVRGLGLEPVAPEAHLPFEDARDNFYKAAQYGLNAQVVWPIDGQLATMGLRQLIVEQLVPLARRGLASCEIPAAEIDTYIGTIAERADSSQNGAAWQRRWLALNGGSLEELVLSYESLQETGEPVHTWPL